MSAVFLIQVAAISEVFADCLVNRLIYRLFQKDMIQAGIPFPKQSLIK
jgi:hypothetical protein